MSVFNGQRWQNYGTLAGPIGSRVFAMAVSPMDGSVWIATDVGLTRYSVHDDRWTYFTRADGLPSDQADALAFDRGGTLYVGTQCDGIAIGSAVNSYKTWRVITGPDHPAARAGGAGLPTDLINALLVGRNGTVYAGTTCGLARSEDGGKSWRYLRGADWAAKAAGGGNTPQAVTAATGYHILREDYVTTLAEDSAGRIWIGYREKDYEVVDPHTGQRVMIGRDGDATAILPISGGYALEGSYGGGLVQIQPPQEPAGWARGGAAAAKPVRLPGPAAPPTAADLQRFASRVLACPAAPLLAAFLRDDWDTGGDWYGRYGRRAAVMCAARSPIDHTFVSDPTFKITGQLGPRHRPGDSLRHFVHWVRTDQPRVMYDPICGYRRESEWDDHGETYPRTMDGPDVWIAVDVPAGVQRVSLYFVNKDGHDGVNRCRDYLIEVKPYADRPEDSERGPTLAKARVRDFWGGVYKQFALKGPGRFAIRICRNNSHNTIVSGVMLDKLFGPPTRFENYPLA
ncbi:MAG TPA: two-component regulator propeller domain-containing protein [Armatimonadota bacterium]|nr:two-component regulator propeller domain-containing protein [Armatimonadota bacterium]